MPFSYKGGGGGIPDSKKVGKNKTKRLTIYTKLSF